MRMHRLRRLDGLTHPLRHPALQAPGAARLEAAAAPPVPRLALQERAHGSQVALMPQEVRLLRALGPELDCVGQRVHGLRVAPDEAAAKVDVGEAVDLALQEGELADVVGNGV